MRSLTSSHLLLRQWRDEDLEYFARLSANPAVMKYLLPLSDRAASDAAAQRIMQHFTLHDFGLWAVELPGVCPFIGFAGLVHVGFQAHFTPAIEVGWRLDPAYWGHGYATEAARLALNDGFEQLELQEVVALTVPANGRSRAVMQRLGMHRVASDDFDHPRVPDGHDLKRHLLYRLSRQDWKNQPVASAGATRPKLRRQP
jgi:RimJ/RimL family protein N-acetyltransferase